MNPEQDSSPQPTGARCAQHPELLARAICSRCGSYACTHCYRQRPDGQGLCDSCHSREPMRVLAERGDRFVANLVDQFIVFLPILCAAFLQLLIVEVAGPDSYASEPLMILGMLASLGVLGYQLYLVGQSGQTLGKRLRNIRMVRSDGSPVSVARVILLRNLVPGLVNSACGFFSLVDALFIFGEERRCLHDVIADTIVVRVDPGEGADYP
jgi:uncharacterized RDD family membrane protein YckC